METSVAGRSAVARFSVNRCPQSSLTIVRQNAHVRAISIREGGQIHGIGERRLCFWRKSGIFCDSCQPVILMAGCKRKLKSNTYAPTAGAAFIWPSQKSLPLFYPTFANLRQRADDSARPNPSATILVTKQLQSCWQSLPTRAFRDFESSASTLEPFTHLPGDALSGQFTGCAFPDHSNAPTRRQQRLSSLQVALHIGFKLTNPEFAVARWRAGDPAPFMPVPVTAMHKQHRAMFRKNQVRLASQPRDVKPETKARPVQRTAHLHFGPGIPAPDARHHAGAGCLVNNVRQ